MQTLNIHVEYSSDVIKHVCYVSSWVFNHREAVLIRCWEKEAFKVYYSLVSKCTLRAVSLQFSLQFHFIVGPLSGHSVLNSQHSKKIHFTVLLFELIQNCDHSSLLLWHNALITTWKISSKWYNLLIKTRHEGNRCHSTESMNWMQVLMYFSPDALELNSFIH